ncbi:MAG: hypothetical protein NTY25_15490 [Planctomycetia bacterium]|nr:hypothetical protein [Planctomycetia bacterium]
MTKNSAHNGKLHPDDDGPKKKDRIDLNRKRIRSCHAELMTRRIVQSAG